MRDWKKKILNAFVSRYIESVTEKELKNGKERSILRIRSTAVFPDFDAAPPDEKESYLGAAEALERKGVIQLTWEKQSKDDRLKTLSCKQYEKLFMESGAQHPKIETAKNRALLKDKILTFKKSLTTLAGKAAQEAGKAIALLDYFSRNLGVRDTGHGMNYRTVKDIVLLLEMFFVPAKLERISPRALSILLYRDSKRLENLLFFCERFLSRAKRNVPCPDFTFLERSYPETLISGKIGLEYKTAAPPIVNVEGVVLGLPLESVDAISAIKTLNAKKEKNALTIENKEVFYALGSPQKYGSNKVLSHYDCFLYTGGYPNRAAAALIKTLAASGFVLHHAGDLDPGGILILQQVMDIAECPVVPLQMNAAVFDKYRPWARRLETSRLTQMKKIREETKAIPGIAELLRRIEETGLGIEQEIIDYRK